MATIQLLSERLPDGTVQKRMPPAAPPEYYKTYAINSPLTTHFKRVSCREFECGNFRHGWSTPLDVSTVKGASTANWIRMKSGRSFTFDQVGTIVTFHFPPGQSCFLPHQVSLQRPENFLVKGGDWRGNPHGIQTYKHVRAEDWVDDCATHQDLVSKIFNRG